MVELNLASGWSVLQDPHEVGEKVGVYKPDWDPTKVAPGLSEWIPIDRLAHLQVLFSENPYFGYELRHYNAAPWWYRTEFRVPREVQDRFARLVLRGVDYFSKIWLNGHLLGEHEGYSSPFEYSVGELLDWDATNVLVARVWSPWDSNSSSVDDLTRAFSIPRNLMKGTYEHADTFVQRDVNPVGIYGPVKVRFHSGILVGPGMGIDVTLRDAAGAVAGKDAPATAIVRAAIPLVAERAPAELQLRCSVSEGDTGLLVASAESTLEIREKGSRDLAIDLSVRNPRRWWTWDRGQPHTYRLLVELSQRDKLIHATTTSFGMRQVELHRNQEETRFFLNGAPLYLRGTTYFPEVYVSRMSRQRYYGDLLAIKAAGCNAVRIHVHVEQSEFYDLCDELGIAVIQDSDFNWVHPSDAAWLKRAVKVFGDMILDLRTHPSIIAWICMNEPLSEVGERHEYAKGRQLNVQPGPQLEAEARRLDPNRPRIRGSGAAEDLNSGDSHNYKGSLSGERTHYLDIYPEREKLNTEFGFDAPPCRDHLARIPEIAARLAPIADSIDELQHYQYRLLKYFIERYRITKYRPCSGYVQFMFRDLCPQSFYGVLDWWGSPKEGLRALQESNQPLGVFLEHHREPVAVWAVNDFGHPFPAVTVRWVVTGADGCRITDGERKVDLPPDSALPVSDLVFPARPDETQRVRLWIHDSTGALLCENLYEDPFRHPPHPKGHPSRMNHDIGMRLYGA